MCQVLGQVFVALLIISATFLVSILKPRWVVEMYLHLIQVQRKLSKIVKDIVRGTLGELPAVEEDNEQEEEKALLEDNEAEGVCNLTKKTSAESSKETENEKRQLQKKARRSQRETAQLLVT